MNIIQTIRKALSRLITDIKAFISNPLRCVMACGILMGAMFVILTATLTMMAFIPSLAVNPLAAVVAPLIQQITLGVLALIGIITLTALGYRNVTASFAGASVSVSAPEEAQEGRFNDATGGFNNEG